jgi:hypothetical protein
MAQEHRLARHARRGVVAAGGSVTAPRLLLIVAMIAALFLIVPRLIGRAVPEQPACDWGASSIVWQDGRVVSGPALTGCAP